MGLDIYLKRYENKADTDQREQEYERLSEQHWASIPHEKYEDLTEAQRDEIRSKCKADASRLNLDEWGSDKINKKTIELDAKTDPTHLFKIGYFRSSYNEGGIHHRLKVAGAMSLEEIMGYGDEYCFQPDWAESKKRAQASLETIQQFAEQVGGCAITCVSGNMFCEPAKCGEKEAMDIYKKERQRHAEGKSGMDCYSNSEGVFYMKEPLEVVAAIPGATSFNQPCVWLVYKQDGGWKWYFDALRIMIETCDYVLAQPDQEKYWLHWSD